MLYQGLSRPRRIALLTVFVFMVLTSLGKHRVIALCCSFPHRHLFIKLPAWPSLSPSMDASSSWRSPLSPSFSVSSPPSWLLCESYTLVDTTGKQWSRNATNPTWRLWLFASNLPHSSLSSAWPLSFSTFSKATHHFFPFKHWSMYL